MLNLDIFSVDDTIVVQILRAIDSCIVVSIMDDLYIFSVHHTIVVEVIDVSVVGHLDVEVRSKVGIIADIALAMDGREDLIGDLENTLLWNSIGGSHVESEELTIVTTNLAKRRAADHKTIRVAFHLGDSHDM